MAHSSNPPRPRLACEITAESVIAARASEHGGSVEMHTIRMLPTGSVVPSLTATNVVEPAALANALADALQTVGGRSRDVTAILPDAAIRTVLLDFDSLPADSKDAAGVVRFRMRKSLPFDVDKAKLSFHVARASGVVRVVAAVALASVIDEYEAAIREAGYAPGVVLPSTLASLSAVESTRRVPYGPWRDPRSHALRWAAKSIRRQGHGLLRRLHRCEIRFHASRAGCLRG